MIKFSKLQETPVPMQTPKSQSNTVLPKTITLRDNATRRKRLQKEYENKLKLMNLKSDFHHHSLKKNSAKIMRNVSKLTLY